MQPWGRSQLHKTASLGLLRNSSVLVAQSHLTLCDPMDWAGQALLSLEFCRQENWSRLSFPSPGDVPYPGIFFCFPQYSVSKIRFSTDAQRPRFQHQN